MKVDFNSLTKEQQEKILDISLLGRKLQEFAERATNKLFIYLFDKKEGNWQYQENFLARKNKNVLSFLNTLDDNKKAMLIANIFYNDKLYDNI